MSENTYKWVSGKLYYMFVPNGKRAECSRVVAADWVEDAKGQSEMNFDEFFDGMLIWRMFGVRLFTLRSTVNLLIRVGQKWGNNWGK